MKESTRTPPNCSPDCSSSPASSQTYVELPLPSLTRKLEDSASVESSHIMDFAAIPPAVHEFPSSPPPFREPEIHPQEMRTISPMKSPRISPTKSPGISPMKSPRKPASGLRFQPYFKSRETTAVIAEFAMKSLRGETAKGLNPGDAFKASCCIMWIICLIIRV